jgi:hypothetical protein
MIADYYIFAYIDPFCRDGPGRDEFYHGMGRGEPHGAHLLGIGDRDVLARIKRIRAAGSEPVFRVVGSALTEDEATRALSALRKLDRVSAAFATRGAEDPHMAR